MHHKAIWSHCARRLRRSLRLLRLGTPYVATCKSRVVAGSACRHEVLGHGRRCREGLPLELKDVAKNQVAAAGLTATVPSGDAIAAAAKTLSDGRTHPTRVDWLGDIFFEAPAGQAARQALKTMNTLIVTGAQMDGKLVKAAAEDHDNCLKAIGSRLQRSDVGCRFGRMVGCCARR